MSSAIHIFLIGYDCLGTLLSQTNQPQMDNGTTTGSKIVISVRLSFSDDLSGPQDRENLTTKTHPLLRLYGCMERAIHMRELLNILHF